MYGRGTWWLSTSDSLREEYLFAQTFSAAGYGGIAGVVGDYKELLEFNPGQLDSALTYEASLHFKAVDPGAINTPFILEHTNSVGRDGVWEEYRNVRAMPMQVEGETISTMRFRPIHGDRAYKLMFKGPDGSKDRYIVTSVVVRPVQVNVWREGMWNGEATLFFNNVPLSGGARASIP